MTVDPFAAYRPKTNAIPQQQEDVFASYRPKKAEEESIGQNIGRHAARTGARVAETVLGAPRAFGEFLESIVPEKALIKGAEKIGLGEGAKTLIETTKKVAPYKLFPKSEDVRHLNEFLFGKSVKPKNEWEEKADETVSDFAALALPLPGSKLKLLKPALLSLGGNIASEVVGNMGGSQKEKTYAKLGTFLTGSLFNPKGAQKLAGDLYTKAKASRPADAMVSSVPLESSLTELEKTLKKGGIAGSDVEALKKIADIKTEMQGAQIPVESLERLKVKINEAKAGIYKQLEGNKPGIKSAKRNLDSVSKTVDNALSLYGKQNPEWEAFYRPANEVHGAIAQSQKARNWMQRHAKGYSPHIMLGLFGIGHAAGIASTLGGAAAAGSALLATELGARVIKSSTLRKYYLESIKSAIKEDSVAFDRNMKKLQEGIEKD